MKFRALSVLTIVLGLSVAAVGQAQTLLSEDFTGHTSSVAKDSSGNVLGGNWLFFNGACLTAGTSPVTSTLSIPACVIDGTTDVLGTYYKKQSDHDQYLSGGSSGYLGSATQPSGSTLQAADPAGLGALRFTNGKPYGHSENGAIVSSYAFPTNAGIQVTFKTVTYWGDGGGNGQSGAANGHDGADGLSFYLIDGCTPVAGAIKPAGCSYPTNNPYGNNTVADGGTFTGTGAFAAIGAWGGSLAYTCTNSNGPVYNGLSGAFLGLGIDEYGNFLNGSSNTASPAFGTTSNLGDNTADGGGQYANRIGLRGAGNITWQALNNAYHTAPASAGSNVPYYPNSLMTCSAGSTLDSNANVCASCPTGSTYSPSAATGVVGSCSAIMGNPQSVTTSTVPAQLAVLQTCRTGTLWNYSAANIQSNGFSNVSGGPTTLHNAHTNPNPANTQDILDYPAIPGGYNVLTGLSIANETANTRLGTTANPTTTIYYNLKVTTQGLLSLSYATDTTGNGPGSYQPVLTNLSITNAANGFSNGAMPNYVRFGFAGSTGGSTNVHEILCFKSVPVVQSSSSAGVNQKQSAKIESGTFAYFAFYDQNKWVGRVTANLLSTSTDTSGAETVSIASVPSWDASCVLTGATAAQCATGVATTAEDPTHPATGRVIVTYNGTAGAPFEWANLTSGTPGQQASLAVGDPASTPTANRVNYLRGDRTNEVDPNATCPQLTSSNLPCFRVRDSVLGDIIDSSPTWVGPPQSPYTATWSDRFNSTTAPAAAENSGQTYLDFASASATGKLTRQNIVYVGANDGMLHGFRSGAFTTAGVFDTTTTTNDGKEVFAYVPGSILQSPASAGFAGGCTSPTATAATNSIVQNIHGVSPAVGSTNACTVGALDFSNVQYGHNFFVDATPGTGDLFYGGKWHTWLVGGLGAGGAAIYALDVTDPAGAIAAGSSGPEAAAAALVVGEWNSSTITCQLPVSGCNANLGNTYGTPIIRRLHNGMWGVIFGNGFGSQTGDAGIYVMTVDASANTKFYYLSACTPAPCSFSGDGIAFVTSADLDGDHITDYVYAGDLKGNVWRFDLTSITASSWAVTPSPLFTTPTGQPITSALTVASGATPAGVNTLLIDFGTGQKNPLTNLNAVTYSGGAQALYGIWDWNLAAWNMTSAIKYASLPNSIAGFSTYPLSQTNLLNNTAVANGTTSVDISGSSTVCWMGSSPTCTGAAGKFGWYFTLIGTQGTGTNTQHEQVIYNPQVLGSAFQVNSIIPASNSSAACTLATDKGFSYAVSVLTGAIIPNFFIQYADTSAAGVETDATGTSFPVTAANGTTWLVYQTVTNQPQAMQVNLGANTVGRRLTWVQLR